MRDYFEQATTGSDAPEPAALRSLGDQIVKDGGGSPGLMNEFAWILLTHPKIERRDLELATRAARLAYDRSEGKDASIIDTYARALFDGGKVTEAIDLQKKAIALTTDETERAQLETTLKQYQAKLN
jgi:hypothetical protein